MLAIIVVACELPASSVVFKHTSLCGPIYAPNDNATIKAATHVSTCCMDAFTHLRLEPASLAFAICMWWTCEPIVLYERVAIMNLLHAMSDQLCYLRRLTLSTDTRFTCYTTLTCSITFTISIYMQLFARVQCADTLALEMGLTCKPQFQCLCSRTRVANQKARD